MADYGTRMTDKAIADLQKRFIDVYSQAEKEMADKLEDYIARHEVRVEKKLAKLKAGQIEKADYDAWMRGQIFQRKQWEAKAASIADTMTHSDEIIQKMINGERVNVFASNANWMSYQMEHGAGFDFGFGLYDSATVTRLLRDEPDLLPPKLVKYKADQAWYQKKITNCITQGIIQGEGLREITKRIMRDAKEASESQAIRNARTAMTGAQNAGRVQSMKEAKKLGIDVKKKWLATLDAKTRDTHQELDGQEVDPEDFFEVDGQYIRYPGDPHARPDLVQNCRCTLVNSYPKYPSSIPRRDNIDGQVVGDMTYKEWFKAKFPQVAPEAEQKYKQIQIQDASNSTDQKPRFQKKPIDYEALRNQNTDYTALELDTMTRYQLQDIAKAVAVQSAAVRGITEEAAVKEFNSKIKLLPTIKIKNYILQQLRRIKSR